MKLVNLIQAREAIKHHTQDKVPFRTAYKFMRFIKETETQDSFYNDKLKELIELCGKKDEDGKLIYSDGMLSLQEDHAKEWSEKIKELYDTDVEAPETMFKPEELDCIEVTTEEMIAIGDFIEEE